MPCYRCGARQTDPVRGASPWRRGVSADAQVLICPDCQRSHDLDLDTCSACASTALICRLGEIECRSCGHRSADERDGEGTAEEALVPADLAAEVEAALSRVLGRS